MDAIVNDFVSEIRSFSKKLSNILVYRAMDNERGSLKVIEDVFVAGTDAEYNTAFNNLSDEAKTFISLHFDNKYWGLSMTGKYISVNSAAATLQNCQDDDVYQTTLKQLDHLLMVLVIYQNLDKFPSEMTYFEYADIPSGYCDKHIMEVNFNFMQAALMGKHREVYSHLFSTRQ